MITQTLLELLQRWGAYLFVKQPITTPDQAGEFIFILILLYIVSHLLAAASTHCPHQRWPFPVPHGSSKNVMGLSRRKEVQPYLASGKVCPESQAH